MSAVTGNPAPPGIRDPHQCPECGRGVRLRYNDEGGVFARHKPGPGGKADTFGWCQGSGRYPGDLRPKITG